MKNIYRVQDFYVCGASERKMIADLPEYFPDLLYSRGKTPFIGILYRKGLDYKKCLDDYLQKEIFEMEIEIGRMELLRMELFEKIPEDQHQKIDEVFDLEFGKYRENVSIMRKSMFEPKKDPIAELLQMRNNSNE